MICPNCGSSVPDDALRCPACRAELDVTMRIPKLDGPVWCEGCGSLIPLDSPTCPGCGLPNPRYVEGAEKSAPDSSEEALDSERTHAIPRIESAIPSDPEEGATNVRDGLPRTRVFILSLLIGVLAMSAIVLLITHPWDPNAFDTKAKTEADTSMAGFPGHVSELQGQDKGDSNQGGEVQSGDDATFDKLTDVHSTLGQIASAVDDNEDLFGRIAVTGSAEERAKGKSAADDLAIRCSNLIDRISTIDVSSGTYEGDAQNMTTLGSWLRNRLDALCEAWKSDVAMDNPSAQKDEVESLLLNSDGASITKSYKSLFDQNYEDWKPQKK